MREDPRFRKRRLAVATDADPRFRVFRAMALTDGDRAAAAKELGESERTLYRDISKLSMHDIIDRCGWSRQVASRGVRPQATKELKESAMRATAMQYIKGLKAGDYQIGAMTKWIFGEDSSENRERTYKLINSMVRMGMVQVDEARGKIMATLTD